MLSIQTIQTLILGGVLGAFAGSVPTITYFSKKGVDIPKRLKEIESTLEATEPVLAVAKDVLPGNKVVNIASEIEHWAKEGVHYSEQLYHTSEITSDDERKNYATETVTTALKELGVTELTENQKDLADKVILAEVNKLGHKDKTEAEKQAQLQQLQAEKAQLATENDNLKNAITQFTANTASTVQPVAQK